jgi:hypothetical protein
VCQLPFFARFRTPQRHGSALRATRLLSLGTWLLWRGRRFCSRRLPCAELGIEAGVAPLLLPQLGHAHLHPAAAPLQRAAVGAPVCVAHHAAGAAAVAVVAAVGRQGRPNPKGVPPGPARRRRGRDCRGRRAGGSHCGRCAVVVAAAARVAPAARVCRLAAGHGAPAAPGAKRKRAAPSAKPPS